MSKKVYGIDLGTTYSCISLVDEFGQPQIINNAENESTTPSVVFFESAENIVVGRAAKEVTRLYEGRVISTVKRSMGKPDIKFNIFDRDYTPQEISARILMKVTGDAEQCLGEKIEDVVISCPAYFDATQKQATKQAGIIAGLNVLYIIPEPTAAAFTYGITQDTDQVILVFDLGGGTFDITVMEIKERRINMVALGGDYELGGKNWDEAIADYFCQIIVNAIGVSKEEIEADHEIYQDLSNLAEICKIRLSSLQKWEKHFAFRGESIKLELTRSKFDEITQNLLENTINYTNKVIEEASSKGYTKIDRLLLVGGSTYMPQILERLKREYSFEIKQFKPNEAVAMGAALMAHKFHLEEELEHVLGEMTGQNVKVNEVSKGLKEKAQEQLAQTTGFSLGSIKKLTETLIQNATSRSIGLVVIDETGQEVVDNLICIQAALPWGCSRMYKTYHPGQTGVELRLMQNEKITGPEEVVPISECAEIRSDQLEFEKALDKGSPIEVTFRLSEDGLLTLDAIDRTTGRELHIKEECKGLLTEQQIQEARAIARGLTVS